MLLFLSLHHSKWALSFPIRWWGPKTPRSVLLVLNRRNPLKLGVGSGTVKGRRLILLFDFYCAWLNVLDVLDHRECVPMQHRAVESVCVLPTNTGCLCPIQMASTLTWHLSHLKKSETECAPWVFRRKHESPSKTFIGWFFQGFLFLSSYQKYVAESGDRVQERKWWAEWFEKSLFMTHHKL